MALLELQNLQKHFGKTQVLRDLSLQVEEGQFVTLLGPSGCGKTTTLRIVAGLTDPDGGDVLLEGRSMLRLPPEKRELNTVFQNYALFPHMNVEKNVAYALRLMGMPARQRAARVAEMLKLVQMEGYEKRMPDKLSGGQRQRIAIARAVAPGRKLLLLDEPLGALDLKLRRQMQEEIKGLQKELGIAFLYITHDQEEALNMSDRIGILHEGRLEQLGTPEEIYERPASRFAAEFIGQSTLLPCRVLAAGPKGMTLEFAGQKLPARATAGFRAGDEALVCLRNERVACLSPEAAAEASLPGTLVSRHYAGGSVRYVIELDAGPRVVCVAPSAGDAAFQPGQRVRAGWNPRETAVVR